MTPSESPADAPALDHLDTARRMAAVLAGIWLSVLGAVGAHQIWVAPANVRQAAAVQRATGLSTPAWIPSGQPLRLASPPTRAVQPRFSPALPGMDPVEGVHVPP